MLYTTIILICAINIPPSDCDLRSATDVVSGPKASLQQCMLGGQTMIAGTRIAPEFSKQYSKVVCRQMVAER